MKLLPDAPPGHARRKALGYQYEIAALRSQGYTLSAIHRALAAAGLKVSLATVGREAARAKAGRAKPASTKPVSLDPVIASAGSQPPRGDAASKHRSGKEIAEEFRRSQTTNHLLRVKEQR